MEDFTGGVVESYDLPKANDNLFEIMAKAAKKKALMSCSIKASPGETEAVMANGLVKGHAYSVTGAREVCVCVRACVHVCAREGERERERGRNGSLEGWW